MDIAPFSPAHKIMGCALFVSQEEESKSSEIKGKASIALRHMQLDVHSAARNRASRECYPLLGTVLLLRTDKGAITKLFSI